MRSFRVFFLALPGAAVFFSAAALRAQNPPVGELIDLCGFQFPTPAGARLISEDSDLVVLQQPVRLGTYDARVHWLISCVPNPRRTSQVSEIAREVESSGHMLHRIEERTLDREVQAAVFSRTRTLKSRRVKTLEAYFATRDVEYRILIAPDETDAARLDAISRSSYNELAGVLQGSLAAGQFRGEVQTTITEAQYRRRLLIFGGLALTAALALMAWIVFRRRRRRTMPTDAGTDPAAGD